MTRSTEQPDPLESIEGSLTVSWEVDADENLSPAEAARRIWQQTFRRGTDQPTGEDACVFTFTDPATGLAMDIDLSLPEFAHLFTNDDTN